MNLVVSILFAFALTQQALAAESTCFGTTANGRLEGGVALPTDGANFEAYSSIAAAIGRTDVHAKVAEIVVAAYKALRESAPGKTFVYGETGWKSGGSFKPHRTHQNGLSVDFMVPVLDADGRSVPLPSSAFNRFGYDLEFDDRGRYEGYTIDFAAIGEHLYQLHRAARSHAADIAIVIFNPRYLPALFATPRGPYLKRNVKFMERQAWWRYDEHYHVDFAVKCEAPPD